MLQWALTCMSLYLLFCLACFIYLWSLLLNRIGDKSTLSDHSDQWLTLRLFLINDVELMWDETQYWLVTWFDDIETFSLWTLTHRRFTIIHLWKSMPFSENKWQHEVNLEYCLLGEISELFPITWNGILCVIDTGCPSQFSCVSCRPSCWSCSSFRPLNNSTLRLQWPLHTTPRHLHCSRASLFRSHGGLNGLSAQRLHAYWRGHQNFHLIRAILTKSLIR